MEVTHIFSLLYPIFIVNYIRFNGLFWGGIQCINETGRCQLMLQFLILKEALLWVQIFNAMHDFYYLSRICVGFVFFFFKRVGGLAWNGAFTMWFVVNMTIDIVYPKNGFGRFGVFWASVLLFCIHFVWVFV